MCISLCVDVMAMSSAFVGSLTRACGIEVSDVYMLKSVGDRTPPCGMCMLAAFDVVCNEFYNGVWDVCCLFILVRVPCMCVWWCSEVFLVF